MTLCLGSAARSAAGWFRRTLAGALVLVAAAAPIQAQAARAPEQAWVSTWATAQQLGPIPKSDVPPPPAAVIRQMSALPRPIAPFPPKLDNQTVRMVIRTTIGGAKLRLQLSNASGAQPVRIGQAHVALRASGAAIRPGSDRAVTFDGKRATTITPGAVIVSDPVDLAVPALTELAVSLYLPEATQTDTVHPLGLNPTYVASGNVAADAAVDDRQANRSYFWLTGIEVSASRGAGAIVAFGDSITDGFATTPGMHRAWPELLAERLQSGAGTAHLSVLNMGISGNRLCRDGAGWSALARFDRDVLSRPGVRWIILLEGINDINMTIIPGVPAVQHATAEQIIDCYSQVIDKAHLHGIKVMGATVTPTEGLWLHTEAGEQMRATVNAWIRGSRKLDALVDFDAVTRDPARPKRLKQAYDPGDHVHLNDAGNAAMAGAIDIGVFRSR
jgi:lysophospholipase L1-like esterase